MSYPISLSLSSLSVPPSFTVSLCLFRYTHPSLSSYPFFNLLCCSSFPPRLFFSLASSRWCTQTSLTRCVSSLCFSLSIILSAVNILYHTSSLILSCLLLLTLPPFSLLPFFFHLQLTSASLTPIVSLFSMLPSPPLHIIIGSVLFYHSSPLRFSISLLG